MVHTQTTAVDIPQTIVLEIFQIIEIGINQTTDI